MSPTMQVRPKGSVRNPPDGSVESVILLNALRSSPELPGRLRRQATEAVRRLGLGAVADSVSLLVSELVTNAVEHGGDHIDFALFVTQGSVVRLEVRDTAPGRPHVHHAGVEDESGRGMFLVNAISEAWGVRENGSLIWCTISSADL